MEANISSLKNPLIKIDLLSRGQNPSSYYTLYELIEIEVDLEEQSNVKVHLDEMKLWRCDDHICI
jgi:hypothetical protein